MNRITPSNENYQPIFNRWVAELKPRRFKSGSKTYMALRDNDLLVFIEVPNSSFDDFYDTRSMPK